MKRLLCIWLFTLMIAVGAASALRADVAVFVGFAENESPPLFFPDPWRGSANTLFLGDAGPTYHAGAILLRNNGNAPVLLGPGAYVDGFANGAHFQLWDRMIGHGILLQPGQNLILTQTAGRNFDTSAQPTITNPMQHNRNHPVVHVTLDGGTYQFTDTAQVLNTGGIDLSVVQQRSSAMQWRPIGTTGIDDPAGTGVVLTSVLTHHNDQARTGQNLTETTLSPANVQVGSFGQLFTRPVDGYVYAQPLVLSNVSIPGKGTHNVLFVATEHDSVYAFDADDNTGPNAQPLWQHSFINPAAGVTSVPNDEVGTGDIVPEIGISGTPVIDPATGTLYVVAKTKEVNYNANIFYPYVQRLHALDIHTGHEKFGGPVEIKASVNGNGDGNDGQGHVPFNPLRQHNRAALLLNNGILYLTFASHGDNIPYHGWILAYAANTLNQIGIHNSTPNGKTDPSGYPLGAGGIWMAGAGPAMDALGQIYFAVGNGSFSANSGGIDFGDSIVKLNTAGPAGALGVADYFTPFNQDPLNRSDADLGSGGLLLLPPSVGSRAHKNLLVQAGKQGTIYLVDRDRMGKFHAGDDSQIVQSLPGAIGGAWSSPAYFNKMIYYETAGDTLKQYSISNALMSKLPVVQTSAPYAYPGATPSISASDTNKGIVWTIENGGNAILHAYDATNVSNELFNSNQFVGRDGLGGYVKFTLPTVANGKVYVGQQYAVSVFGGGFWTEAPIISPNSGTFASSVYVSITDATPGADIRYTTDGSDPTPTSTHYTRPFPVYSCSQVKAKAFAYGFRPSGVVTATLRVGVTIGTGDGLTGNYFNNINLNGNPTTVQVDPTVNFNWNGNSPTTNIPRTRWSARWTGKVQALCGGVYTFQTITDDGVRLWVNGQLIIDNWTDHAPTTDTGTITLAAGQKYDIKLEYYQNGGGSVMQLFWSDMGLPFTVIPQNQLYSH
ncbi:MAG TPA: PA14 domain-containing protein [Chthonomonadaceae bacterium]|nr:PA14 domain-containing protein [Chthonomonadaceae bacterium]